MKKLIIEVGSTCTKVDLFDGQEINRIKTETIEFKRNYKKENKLDKDDVEKLISLVKELKGQYQNIYVCGTSIFRSLSDEQRNEFLNLFLNNTGIKFDIISPEKENELTVEGAARNVNKKVAVFVGGGGSTEISIYDNGIKEMVNTPIGVIDIMNKYPDLGDNYATTSIDEVKKAVREKLNLPKQKADTLILAGGGHLHFALNAGISYEKNTLYEDKMQPCYDGHRNKRKVMRGLGILEYNKELASLVDNKEEIKENSEYEVEIRANMIVVIDMVKEKLNNEFCAIDINDYIWGQARNKNIKLKPYHLTRNTNY